MPVRRGVVYEYQETDSNTAGLLVLSNDDWNDTMSGAVVVPLRIPETVPFPDFHPSLRINGQSLMIMAGRLLDWKKEELGAPMLAVEDELMDCVEDALVDILSLKYLCVSPPVFPASPSGITNYPRWGEIYYAGKRIAGERKRYVVVSNDFWNKATGTAIAVRTTSQTRKGGSHFPSIQQGAARACCGNVTTYRVTSFSLRGTDRPAPSRLNLTDMSAVAKGLVEVLLLDRALRRNLDTDNALDPPAEL